MNLLNCEKPHPDITFFNQGATLLNIQEHYQGRSLHRLKQTHSDISVSASVETIVDNPTVGPSSSIGDALVYSGADTSFALITSTADCLPIMILSQKFIAAIHAGWRGVQNEIVLKTLKKYESQIDKNNISVFIGPHIQYSSFEVDLALAQQFLNQAQGYSSYSKALNSVFKPSSTRSDKAYVNLAEIIVLQLEEAGLRRAQIWVSEIDTMTNKNWASYRRQGPSMGKNLSIVARRSD